MSLFQQEQRERLNPHGLDLVDVMLGRGRIERRRIFNRQRGAGKWKVSQCVFVLAVSVAGTGFMFLVVWAMVAFSLRGAQ